MLDNIHMRLYNEQQHKKPVKKPDKPPVKPPVKTPVKPPPYQPIKPPAPQPIKPPYQPVKPPVPQPVKPPVQQPDKPDAQSNNSNYDHIIDNSYDISDKYSKIFPNGYKDVDGNDITDAAELCKYIQKEIYKIYPDEKKEDIKLYIYNTNEYINAGGKPTILLSDTCSQFIETFTNMYNNNNILYFLIFLLFCMIVYEIKSNKII